MAISFLALSDQADGKVKLELQYEGGFDPKSHAHQQLKLVLTILDKVSKYSRENVGAHELIDETIKAQAAFVTANNEDEMHQLAKLAMAGELPVIAIANASGEVVG